MRQTRKGKKDRTDGTLLLRTDKYNARFSRFYISWRTKKKKREEEGRGGEGRELIEGSGMENGRRE